MSSGLVGRSEMPTREVLEARPLAERAQCGAQPCEQYIDGAQRAVQAAGTASRAVDGR
jgi:hypothetical protein